MAGELQSIVIADNSPIDPQGGIGPSGDGWVAECVLADITDTAGTLDASKLVIQVSDPGYLADGVETTVNRTIRGTTFLHRTHPNGDERLITTDGTDLTLQVALEESIYSGTTIISVDLEAGFYDGSAVGAAQSITNLSTFAYKKPIGAWINFNGVTSLSSTVDVEFVPAHESARNGQQVACVEFYADDGSTVGPSVFSNASQLSALITQGNIPEVFAGSVDLTGQTQADYTLINAKVYPWIGDASAVMDLAVDGYAWPTALPLTPLRVFNDSAGTYGTVYAYVDGVGAGTPAANPDEETAKLAPFATIQDAMQGTNGVSAWNFINRGRSDFGGGVVRFINDSAGVQNYDIDGNVNDIPGVGVCVIESDPLAVDEITLTMVSQSLIPGTAIWRNLSLIAEDSPYLVVGWDLSGSPDTGVYFDGCRLDNAANKSGIIWHAYRSLRNCTFSGGNEIDLFEQGFGPDNKAISLMAGCVSADRDSIPQNNGATGYALALIGNDLPGYNQLRSFSSVGDHGMMIINNRLKTLNLNNTSPAQIDFGLANIQNIYEYEEGVSVICMNAFADGDLTDIDNYLEYYNTAAGERASRMYNDNPSTQIAPIGLVKTGQSRFSVWDNYNIKDDRFNEGDGSGSVGNWRYEYSVGNVGNVSLFGNTRRSPIYLPANDSTDEYLGSYWQDESLPNWLNLGATETEIMDTFANWTTTPRAAPAIGGDYRLTSASTELFNRVPANQAALSFDLDGEPRLNDGTGAAGAYEFASAVDTPPEFDDPGYDNDASYDFNESVTLNPQLLQPGSPAPTFSTIPATLPAGLSIDSATGIITGTLSALGAVNFIVTVSNSEGGDNTLVSFSVDAVAPVLTGYDNAASYSDGDVFAINPVFSTEPQPAATFEITSGTPPQSFTFDSVTGEIDFDLDAAGPFSFEVTATNEGGSSPATVSFDVNAEPDVSYNISPIYGIDRPVNISPTINKGFPALSFAISAGVLPSGWVIDGVTGDITGTSDTLETANFTITATNTEGSQSLPFTVDIIEAPSVGGGMFGGLSLGIGIGLTDQYWFGVSSTPIIEEDLTFNGEPLQFNGEQLTT